MFFCCHNRTNGREFCNEKGAESLKKYAKQKINSLKLESKLKIRVNLAGCMNRCAEGPILVIYPEGTWYTFIDESDIDEIIQSHIINGIKVERLELKN
jgi:(2Fe-2S) ferredoxin